MGRLLDETLKSSISSLSPSSSVISMGCERSRAAAEVEEDIEGQSPQAEAIVRCFLRAWRFHRTGWDDAIAEDDADGAFLRKASTELQWEFDDLTDRVQDIVLSFLTYAPARGGGSRAGSKKAAADVVDENCADDLKYLYLSAFKHTYGIVDGFTVAHVASRKLLAVLVQYHGGAIDNVNLLLWLHFYLWMMIGRCQSLADLQTNERPVRSSKVLTLEEFEQACPFDQVSNKAPEKSHCVFVSHRWQTPDHPDPRGTERNLTLPLLRRAQVFLDYLLGSDDSISPDLWYSYLQGSETEVRGNEADLYGRAFQFMKSVETTWALHFFVRRQRAVLVWYDFFSVPQEHDPDSRETRTRCLQEIDAVCRSMPIFAIPTGDYFTRAWCVFECIQCTLGDNNAYTSLLFCEPHRLRKEAESVDNDRLFFTYQEHEMKHVLTINRLQSLHGIFCRHLELGVEADSVLSVMRMKCTNGTDLKVLSTKLENLSSKPERGPEVMADHVHPFLSAYRLFLDDLFWMGDDEYRGNYYKVEDDSELYAVVEALEYYRMKIQFEPALVGDDRKCLDLHFRHPGYALSYLVQTKRDWGDTIVGFDNTVGCLLELLHSVAELCRGCPVDLDPRLYKPPRSNELFSSIDDILKVSQATRVSIQLPPS